MPLSNVGQFALTCWLLRWMLKDERNFEAMESVREGIRSVLTGCGLRPSLDSLVTMWCCITSAQISYRANQTPKDFDFVVTSILGAAPNQKCYGLRNIASYPWANHMLSELPKSQKTMDEFCDCIPREHSELRAVLDDCSLLFNDIITINARCRT